MPDESATLLQLTRLRTTLQAVRSLVVHANRVSRADQPAIVQALVTVIESADIAENDSGDDRIIDTGLVGDPLYDVSLTLDCKSVGLRVGEAVDGEPLPLTLYDVTQESILRNADALLPILQERFEEQEAAKAPEPPKPEA